MLAASVHDLKVDYVMMEGECKNLHVSNGRYHILLINSTMYKWPAPPPKWPILCRVGR